MRRNNASSTHGRPQCATITRRSPEHATDVVEQRRTAELQLRVDPRRPGLVDHDRDAQLLGLRVDRERDVCDRWPPSAGTSGRASRPRAPGRRRSLELRDRRVGPLVERVHRREPDEPIGVGSARPPRCSRCRGRGASGPSTPRAPVVSTVPISLPSSTGVRSPGRRSCRTRDGRAGDSSGPITGQPFRVKPLASHSSSVGIRCDGRRPMLR